jgi:hypothetical protein
MLQRKADQAMSDQGDGAPEDRARAKYLKLRPAAGAADAADNDVQGAAAFTLTRGELSALVREAVAEANAAGGGPLLVDKQRLAQKLGCSAAHIDALRKRGLPVVMLGVAVRFEPAAVLDWLRQGNG